ncbi:E3 ubiquitin-protein ligase MARCHF11 [Monodelphis domestica]|uniref:E3 ubiquitin-protein ligase MARCHF11 n=1 Tax=Monodelphis domestica TaxID=13616 RepID=UPI0024E20A68|nr:E3 ubiquitin-protein ligase MARCHF11 [Monodelphis domestica]
MSLGGGNSSRRRRAESGDPEPLPLPLPPPPGEPATAGPPRYLPPLPPPLPALPALPPPPQAPLGPAPKQIEPQPLAEGIPRRGPGEDLPPLPSQPSPPPPLPPPLPPLLPPPPPPQLPLLLPLPLPSVEQEPSTAGDSGEGFSEPLPPEAVIRDSEEPQAARVGGEAEGQSSEEHPETRSVCSSRSSSSSSDQRTGHHQHQHHQPICKICFQGAEQGELLNPCRCDGSVRYTHQLCLLKWISERGSWTCELCCYRYHVIAIKMKKPCQWQSISITLVEKVQMIAVILGSLFLIASVTWLLWSAFSPYAVWQRKDILFQICYGMYGFMDLVCIGLIVHEGAAVYRVFKRWRAVNLHWDVLNYDKATDIEESSRGESSTSRTLWLPLTALRNRNLVHPTQLTSPRFQCGYVLLHLFNRMRPHEDLSEDNSSGEVVMRVTSV